MVRYNYEEIQKAVEILGLSETATIAAIKSRFKKLIARWHPDKAKDNSGTCTEMTQKINGAYETLMKYCLSYDISFQKEDIEKTLAKSDETWWSTRFGDDPIWGR